MVYDAENRIKQFFRGSNGGSTPDAVYQYDGEGKRVRKTADGEETVFVYNAGGQLVAEYSTQISTTPEVSYLTADHLGSPRIVTDALGNVRSRHDYLAYGDEVTDKVGQVAGRSSGQGYGEEDDVRKQYTGYERDDESGLDYAQARYYNSSHGRYTSVDPLTASASIRNPQTFNRYSYVLNSPYKFTDPLGLISENTVANGGRAWCSTCQTSDDDNGWFADPPVLEEAASTEEGIAKDDGASGNPQEGDQQQAEASLPPLPPDEDVEETPKKEPYITAWLGHSVSQIFGSKRDFHRKVIRSLGTEW